MKLKFSKYEGTGNDFIIIDNREHKFDANNFSLIKKLCDRRFGIGADGLILLNAVDKFDYGMEYFNADGNIGSMCGNGGRCLAAFANRTGIIKTEAVFKAIDGVHQVKIESYDNAKFNAMVFLKMNDVKDIERGSDYCYLYTGSPHYVKFVDNPDKTDVISEGKKIRYNDRFREEGTNVNFISIQNDRVFMRTYERGVENETLSCGTGAVASALAAVDKKLLDNKKQAMLITKGGNLVVHFEETGNGFKNIFLEGPVSFVFDGEIEIEN